MTETPERLSLTRKLAGAAAIVFAVSVIGCRIYDAQVGANARAGQPPVPGPVEGPRPSGADALAEPTVGEVHDVTGALSSSKVIVLDESTFLSGSKSGVMVDSKDIVPVLPSSKGMVLNESETVFLPSSKFIALPPEVPATISPTNGKSDRQSSARAVRRPTNPSFLSSSKSMVIDPKYQSEEDKERDRKLLEQLMRQEQEKQKIKNAKTPTQKGKSQD